MLIDAEKLRANVEETARRLAEDPSPGLVRPRVTTRLVRDVVAESEFLQYDRPFRFLCDESVERGGLGQNPSPMRYFLSGVAFCQQVWYAKGAALVGCRLDALEIDLETVLDMRGEHLVGGEDPAPRALLLEARVTSPDAAEVVLAMVDEADRRCPLFNLVRRALPIRERVLLNGQQVRDAEVGSGV